MNSINDEIINHEFMHIFNNYNNSNSIYEGLPDEYIDEDEEYDIVEIFIDKLHINHHH